MWIILRIGKNLRENSMRFLDANIFIYAYYKPKKKLSDKAKWMKEESKRILKKINDSKEKVVTTVVHLSEVNNFLKKAMDPDSLQNLLLDIYSLHNLKIVDVTVNDYVSTISMISETGLDANDCLALKVMRNLGLNEIYSFDKCFERFVKRLP